MMEKHVESQEKNHAADTPDPENFLGIIDVDKMYGERRVLDNVDLSVRQGELCAVVGPSGCGKSTLLRLILGQEPVSSGMITIDGEEVGLPNLDRGVVYQRYSLFPHLTVLQNVTLGMRFRTPLVERWQRRKEFDEEGMYFLEKVGLEKHYKKYPHELSGGMQQRVAVVQALIMKPKILLMDEPFGALDPGTREDIQLFLLELWEEFKMTIFFVTHDLEEAVFLGSRLVVLSQYYTDDRGHTDGVNRGSKVVGDYLIKADRQLHPTQDKYSEGFLCLIEQIRQEGFDPEILQHASEFNLRHPHSFQTLTTSEHGKNGQGEVE